MVLWVPWGPERETQAVSRLKMFHFLFTNIQKKQPTVGYKILRVQSDSPESGGKGKEKCFYFIFLPLLISVSTIKITFANFSPRSYLSNP